MVPGSNVVALFIVLAVAGVVLLWMRSDRMRDMQAQIRRLCEEVDEIRSRLDGGPPR